MNIKKLIIGIFAVCIIMSMTSVMASAASVSWVMNQGGFDGFITSFKGTLPQDVVVPATVNGQAVIGVGPFLLFVTWD